MMGVPLTCAHSVACWLTLPTPGRRLCLLWHGTQPAPLLVPSLPHYLSAPISIWPFVLGTYYFLSLHTNLSASLLTPTKDLKEQWTSTGLWAGSGLGASICLHPHPNAGPLGPQAGPLWSRFSCERASVPYPCLVFNCIWQGTEWT